MPTRVLVACDKFKDALTAERACAIVAREVRRVHPAWSVSCVPLTDGGEGFARILTDAAGGEMHAVPAAGPQLEPCHPSLGLAHAARLPPAAQQQLGLGTGARRPVTRLAVIEMAAVNGLAMLPPVARDPWQTTSLGTGQLIRAAAELGADFVLLGVGGSATSDLGLGALAALGYEFRDAQGERIRPPFPATWERIETITGAAFEALPPIAIACDVTNPLLGARGAAAVYGPQKGLKAADLPRHEAQAERLADGLCRHCGADPRRAKAVPGTGAAGGISFGLMVGAGARLVPGFDLVSAWLDLEAKIAAADIVITGEGRFDASSLTGKGPGAIVQRARALRRRVCVLAGSVAPELQGDGDCVAITPPGMPLGEALARAADHLALAAARCC